MQAFRSDVLAAFDASTYSNLRVSLRRLGRRFAILSDPEDIAHVMNTHIDRYRPNVLAQRLLEPLTGRGLVLLEGDEWQQLHKQLIPVFQPRHIERLIPRFHATTAIHIDSWTGGRSRDRNLLPDFRRLTLGVIASSMLSVDDEAKAAELADFASQGESAGALLRWQDYVALLAWRGVPQPAERRQLNVRWRIWIQAFLDQRPPIDDIDQARDMLDLLRAARDGNGALLTPVDIADQVGSMLAAGFATTALALYWSTVILALFPEHQEAVRRDLCGGQAPDVAPTAQSLRSSRVATAFLYECMRLYPPAYVIAREAHVDDDLGDYVIPRGTSVIVAPWLVHRHAALWPDPGRFDPGRFLQDGKIVTPKAWMPFGTGPRVCIGAAFAVMELLVIFRYLLGRYRVSLLGPVPQPVGRVTLLPDSQPLFRLTPL
jgi:cytochrome P450